MIKRLRFLVVWIALGFAIGAAAAPPGWREEQGHRWAALAVNAKGRTGFTRLEAKQCGVDFLNELEQDESLDGSGVALGDFDGDGRCDVYFCHLRGRNRLYRNLGGWKFKDVTEEAGVACEGQRSKGACFADVNSDGHLDLFVTAIGAREALVGGLRLFLGDGAGHFRETTGEAGVASNSGSHTLAFGDVNGDGWLDCYVANNRTEGRDEVLLGFSETLSGRRVFSRVAYDINNKVTLRVDFPMLAGRFMIPPALKDRFEINEKGEPGERGFPDALLLGDGYGKFRPVSWTAGDFLDEDGKPVTEAPHDLGLSATIRDFDGNGTPDIYVCNDFGSPDRMWLGDGKGGFRAAPRTALRNIPYSSMGVEIGDLDRDGNSDFFVVEMKPGTHAGRVQQMPQVRGSLRPPGMIEDRPQLMRNTLYWNRGDTTWSEIAHLAGIDASDWSWQPIFLDVDLDGYEDIFVCNGYARDMLDQDVITAANVHGTLLTPRQQRDLLATYPRLAPPKFAWRNRGDLTFEDKATEWGLDARDIAQGTAEADFDNDGDLDLVLNVYRGAPLFFRNGATAPRVAVRLKGLTGNPAGAGAKITLRGGAVPVQTREMFVGGRYLSGGDPQLCFAAGKGAGGMSIEVMWRGGAKSLVDGVLANRIYEISEPSR